ALHVHILPHDAFVPPSRSSHRPRTHTTTSWAGFERLWSAASLLQRQSKPEAHRKMHPAHRAEANLAMTRAQRCRRPTTAQRRQWPGRHHLSTLRAATYRHLRQRVDVAEGHLVISELHDSVVRERDAEDIRRQILERSSTTADQSTVDHPRLCPGCGWYLG